MGAIVSYRYVNHQTSKITFNPIVLFYVLANRVGVGGGI